MSGSPLALWPLRGAAASFALFLAGPVLAHLELLPPMAGFALYLFGAFSGGSCALAGGIASALAGGGRRGLLAVVLGTIPALGLAVGMFTSASHPPIHDVSTDLHDPPACPAGDPHGARIPAEVRDVQAAAYPELRPARFAHPVETVRAAALEVIRARSDWSVVADAAGNLNGVATSRLFRFKDDFAIRFGRVDGATVVDMRSHSRNGRGDLGANAARIRGFMAALTGRLERAAASPPSGR